MNNWPVFICYRQSDGRATAERLYSLLQGLSIPTPSQDTNVEEPSVLDIYYDQAAPGIGDWTELHEPYLKRARALIVVCTPGAKLDEGEKDWVHREINWWIASRSAAPILIDALGEEDRYIPGEIADRWPNTQRIKIIEAQWNSLTEEEQQPLRQRIQARILGAITYSGENVYRQELALEQERTRELQEALHAQQTLSTKLKWAFLGITVLLLFAVGAAWLANWQRQLSESRRIIAESDRLANEALLQFEAGNNIEALCTALKSGLSLKSLVGPSDAFQEYPTVTPLSALQTILDQIVEQNRIEHQDTSSDRRERAEFTLKSTWKGMVKMRDGKSANLVDLSNEEIVGLMGHNGSLLVWGCSPEGRYIISGATDGTVRLRDVRDVRPARLIGLLGGISKMMFHPQGNRFLATNVWGTTVFWDYSGANVERHRILLEGHEATVRSVSFSHQGDRIVTGDVRGTIRLWNAAGQALGTPIRAGRKAIIVVAFSVPEDGLLALDENGTIRTWDLAGKLLSEAETVSTPIVDAAFNAERTIVAMTLAGGGAYIRVLNGPGTARTTGGHTGWILGVDVHPKRNHIVTAGADNTIRILTLGGELVGQPIVAGQEQVQAVGFDPEGKHLVSAGTNRFVKVWSTEGQLLAQMTGEDQLLGVLFSPDGRLIAASEKKGIVRVWLSSGQLVATYPGHYGPLAFEASGGDFGTPKLAFSPDGKSLAIPQNGGLVAVWRLQGLDELLDQGYAWLKSYLDTHPGVLDARHQAAGGITGAK